MDRVPAVVRHHPQPAARKGVRLALLASLLFAVSCSTPPARLAGTLETPEALASAVLDALAARDESRLRVLALTEAEFSARVWPELPASRPERNLTADYVWKDLAQKSEASLLNALSRYGGRRFVLRGLEFAGETTHYQTFSVSRKTELVVADQDGAEERIRVFGSMLRADGGVKVFSYVVD